MKVVMLVEDDDETREALASILEDADYRVLRAANGAAAWSLLQDHGAACDIILLDLMMPVMNGWDFRRKQKESPNFSSIPVVLMSAGGNIASSCADLDTSDYIAKPVEVEELLNRSSGTAADRGGGRNVSVGSHSTPGAEGISQLGRYKLIQLLGVGGMAEVFKARCPAPGGFERTVVVKRILPTHSRDPEFVRMFVAEAQLLGLLHHPNVVQAYDLGEFEGTLFLVLEYVNGPSLSRVMSTLRTAGGRMPVVAAAHFALEVCRALDHVHSLKGGDGQALKVIHRDVTPSNILLTQSGGIKLLDFGVAKYRASQARSVEGTVKGKPAYLAPEALEAKEIDNRVDIFSLGIVLHEILTLRSLFESDNQVLTFRKILELPIPTPSSLRPEVPRELDAIVMKALERDPDRRYQNAEEMATDLNRFVIDQRLRMDEVCAFVRGIRSQMAPNRFAPQAIAPPPPPAMEQSTKRYRNPRSLGARLRRLFTRAPRPNLRP